MTLGNRILARQKIVSQDMVEKYRELPVANVSDCMSRMFAGGNNIRPLHNEGGLAGPALTVRCRPGDNLFLHKAIDLAQPGDVIVCDGGGDLTNALMGELMLIYAAKRGVAGFVLNGAVRDVEAIREFNLPLFAAGVTHRGPYKNGPGEVNVPVNFGGMIIEPGDLVLGDSDGVLSVPYDSLDEVLAQAKSKQEAENKQMSEIHSGTVDRSWVDQTLKVSGCQMS
ncbi:RraA family protein [Franzmannia pantelleriensis]|uniref:RraA family protein n=1 Tax=Franzmannia pantelleriensis TaxID=48727 RepID=UPI000B7CFDB4|nr:RraA family protein [Halomonas pantelleriensis]